MFYRNWRDLIKPTDVSIDPRTKSATYGEFEVKPLERGYGITVGNALRRILLSSIMGAAVTKVKMEGALHEFTTLPEVKEDVTDILMNLKELKLQLHSDDAETVEIDVEGPKEITGADITGSSAVEVLNPDHKIATVSKEGSLHMELVVDWGRGYVSAEQNKSEDDSIDVIPVDSIFSPIKKVNYQITNARVGQRTDYDKLSLEVWTDGSVQPEDAVAYAAKILKEQVTIFINFDESAVEPEVTKEDEGPEFEEELLKPIDELELSVRSFNCLKSAGINYVGDLVQQSENDLLKIKNFGRKSLKEVKGVVEDLGFELGKDLEKWPPAELEEKAAESGA